MQIAVSPFSITTILRLSSFFTGTVRSRHMYLPAQALDKMMAKQVVLQQQAPKNWKRARRKKRSPKARQLSRCVQSPALTFLLCLKQLLHTFTSLISLCTLLYFKNLLSYRLLRTWNGGLKVSTSKRKTSKVAFSLLVKKKERRQQLLMLDTHCLKRRYLIRLRYVTKFWDCMCKASMSLMDTLPFSRGQV